MDTVIEALKAAWDKAVAEDNHRAYQKGYNTCEKKWRAHMAAVSTALATAPTKVEITVDAPVEAEQLPTIVFI